MASKKAVSKVKFEIPDSDKFLLLSAFRCTWEYIAQDALEGGRLTNKQAITMCFDYVDRDGNDAGEGARIARRLIEQFGFKKVLTFLTQQLNLI